MRWLDGRGSWSKGGIGILGSSQVDLLYHVPLSEKSVIEVRVPQSAALPNDYRGARYYVAARWRITTEFLGLCEPDSTHQAALNRNYLKGLMESVATRGSEKP